MVSLPKVLILVVFLLQSIEEVFSRQLAKAVEKLEAAHKTGQDLGAEEMPASQSEVSLMR